MVLQKRRQLRMIIRIWRGQAIKENAPAYFKHITETVFPSLTKINGYKGGYVLQRETDGQIEFLGITTWESVEVIKAFAGEDIETAIVEPAARAILTEFDDFARHYDLTYGDGREKLSWLP
jgi:heme-degrading monooxygenase HmoA